MPAQKVWAVTDRLLGGGLRATLVWSWTMQYDGGELADLCSSRLTDREIVDRLTELTGVERTVAA